MCSPGVKGFSSRVSLDQKDTSVERFTDDVNMGIWSVAFILTLRIIKNFISNMAQRKRAGLITRRTFDRNEVLLNIESYFFLLVLD